MGGQCDRQPVHHFRFIEGHVEDINLFDYY